MPASQDEIGKGYELTKTQVVPITDEELSNLPLPLAKAKAIEIEEFVPLESVDPSPSLQKSSSEGPEGVRAATRRTQAISALAAVGCCT